MSGSSANPPNASMRRYAATMTIPVPIPANPPVPAASEVSYPVSSTASRIRRSVSVPASYPTSTRPAAKLAFTASTPGSPPSACSILFSQERQVIPCTKKRNFAFFMFSGPSLFRPV